LDNEINLTFLVNVSQELNEACRLKTHGNLTFEVGRLAISPFLFLLSMIISFMRSPLSWASLEEALRRASWAPDYR